MLSIPFRFADKSHRKAQDRNHKDLMDAALARDSARMDDLISHHIQRTAEIILEFMQEIGGAEKAVPSEQLEDSR